MEEKNYYSFQPALWLSSSEELPLPAMFTESSQVGSLSFLLFNIFLIIPWLCSLSWNLTSSAIFLYFFLLCVIPFYLHYSQIIQPHFSGSSFSSNSCCLVMCEAFWHSFAFYSFYNAQPSSCKDLIYLNKSPFSTCSIKV